MPENTIRARWLEITIVVLLASLASALAFVAFGCTL